MSVLDWFVHRFRNEAAHYLYVPVPATHVRYSDGTPAANEPLVAASHYFRVILTEMFLKNDRDWFSNWYPAVHSAVSFQFSGKPQVLTNVLSQTKQKDLGTEHLDKFVAMNQDLTGLLPYNDGSVTIDAGLVALEGTNDLRDLIKAVGSIGSLLTVTQLSAAVKVAEPLANTVAALVGATNGKLMIGINQTFSEKGGGTEAVLQSGYQAMLDAKAGQFDKANFWVDKDHLTYGDTIDSAKQVTGVNYLLLRIEKRDERKDWDELVSIHDPYQEVLKALQSGTVEQAEVHLRTAIAAALAAPELTKKVDRRRVVEQLKAKFESDKRDLGAGGFSASDFSLQSIMAKPRLSADDAAAMTLITTEEAFAGIGLHSPA